MASSQELKDRKLEDIVRGGFRYPRRFDAYPELPPGYDWKTQIKKYSPSAYYSHSTEVAESRQKQVRKERKGESPRHGRWLEDAGLVEPKEKPYYHFGVFRSRSGVNPLKELKVELNRAAHDKFNAVFCHRGLYDRALRIPENPSLAIKNGINRGLLFHELDTRLGPRSGSGQTFLAHDEVAERVTSKDERWSALNLSVILETALVTRRFDLEKNDFASSFQNTEANVPDLEKLLTFYSEDHESRHCIFQIDLRGHDFPRAIAWFRFREHSAPKVLLKGYNLTFPYGPSLRAAVESISSKEYNTTFDWKALTSVKLPIIMVFYSQPIIALALRALGKDPDTATPADRFSLGYGHLLHTTLMHVTSFIELLNTFKGFSNFIPEIVYSGLGLGYNV